MKKTVLIFLLLVNLPLFSQNKEIDSSMVFTSMEKALKNPEQVFHLDLSNKRLKDLPADLNKFTRLKSLNLSKNKLKSVGSLSFLKGLEEIDLSKNKLKDFPEEVTVLYTLERLDIGGNDIDSIPPSITHLKKLEYLSAWGNNFRNIPSYLGNLASLEKVDFRAMLFSFDELDSINKYMPNVDILHDEGCDCD